MTIASLVERMPKVLDRASDLNINAKIAAFLTMFLIPLYEFITIIIIFLVFDMLASIYLQYKQTKNRCAYLNEKKQFGNSFKILWRTINADKISYTIEKMVSYSVALIICFLLDYFILRLSVNDDGSLFLISITNAAFVMILLSESKSILVHLGKITNNAIFNELIRMITKKTNRNDTTNSKPDIQQ